MEALEELWSSSSGDQDLGSLKTVASGLGGANPGTAARLKAQMQADELRPLDASSEGSDEGDKRPLPMGVGGDSDGKEQDEVMTLWPEETLLQAGDYLRLNVSHSAFHFFSHWSGHRRSAGTLSYMVVCSVHRGLFRSPHTLD